MSQRIVLIVDDHVYIRVQMGKALARTGEYQILYASDGMAAIELMRELSLNLDASPGIDLLDDTRARQAKIDCIVSDIDMLPMNGLEFVKAVRMGLADVARDVPVVVLTSHTDKKFLSAAMALDVGGFIIKPATADVLRERIERAMATLVALKPATDYAILHVPEVDGAAASKPGSGQLRADDLAAQMGRMLPQKIPPSELTSGDRLLEDLTTEDGVVVAPRGTQVGPALIESLKDLSEFIRLQARVSVFRQ